VLNLVSGALFSVDVVDVGAESAQGLRGLVEGIVEAVAKLNVSDLFPFLRPVAERGRKQGASWQLAKLSSFHNFSLAKFHISRSNEEEMYVRYACIHTNLARMQ
jgi:hypothetical protein